MTWPGHPQAKVPTYVKAANFPGLYRHARSGRHYACKKLGGIRRERGLGTCDRKIPERRLKEWIGNLDKVDAEMMSPHGDAQIASVEPAE